MQRTSSSVQDEQRAGIYPRCPGQRYGVWGDDVYSSPPAKGVRRSGTALGDSCGESQGLRAPNNEQAGGGPTDDEPTERAVALLRDPPGGCGPQEHPRALGKPDSA